MNAAGTGTSGNWNWSSIPGINTSGSNVGVLNGPGGGGGANQVTGQNESTSSGGSYFGIPDVAQSIAGDTSGLIHQQAGQYNQFVTDPFASPVTNNAIAGYLAGLTNSENMARQNLADQFRAAGNTSSSTFGQKAMGLEGDILQKRFSGVADIVSKLYPEIAQAMYNPISQGASTIDATKLQQQQSQSQGYSTGSNKSGLAGGGWQFTPGYGVPGAGGGVQFLG